MELLIDAGNSRIKWAKCVDMHLLEDGAILHQENALPLLQKFLTQHRPQRIILVHVLGSDFEYGIKQYAKVHSIPLLIVHSHSDAYGIHTHYLQPQRLGADRFVAMAAAYQVTQQHACIVIDCGTAVTVDAVNPLGEHIGGMIYPGLQLCKESLTQKAKNLKKLDSTTEKMLDPCAKETLSAINSGCHYGLSAAIDGMCQKMEQKMTCDITKILCGGDSTVIYNLLPQRNYKLTPDLVIQGLKLIANRSLTYNKG
jgi:type III pantothenate kinase